MMIPQDRAGAGRQLAAAETRDQFRAEADEIACLQTPKPSLSGAGSPACSRAAPSSIDHVRATSARQPR